MATTTFLATILAIAMEGWQDRLWSLFLLSSSIVIIVYIVFFHWIPRLAAPRCPVCGEREFLIKRRHVSPPHFDESGRYHRGREEVVYRCQGGHERQFEREYIAYPPP